MTEITYPPPEDSSGVVPKVRRRGPPLHSRGTSVWTPERDAELTRLWADPKLSTSQIGKVMGLNKSQCIGRAHRMRLPFKVTHAYAPYAARKPVTQRPRRVFFKIPHCPPLTPQPPLTSLTPLTPEPPREYGTVASLVDVREDQCRFPIEDGMWCGRPRGERSSYCDEHHRRSHHKGREQ
jgi:hypothetical protein